MICWFYVLAYVGVEYLLKGVSNVTYGHFTHKTEGPKKTSWMKNLKYGKVSMTSPWSPSWRTMDKVSWFAGIYIMPTSKRWD